MRYLVDMFDGKFNFINNISEQTCIQISQAAENVQEVLEMYALGACVRDALDELTEWCVNANESGNYIMRNLHTAERLCRGFLFEFRTCLDHMETEIKRKHGKDSELCKVFKDSVSKAYDTCSEYAFTYHLRNCSQHCKNIVHGFNGSNYIGISSNGEKLLNEFDGWKPEDKEFIQHSKRDIDLLEVFSKAFSALNKALSPVVQYLLEHNEVCQDIRYLRKWGDSLSKTFEHDVHSFHMFDIKFKDGKEAKREDMATGDVCVNGYPFDWDMIYELTNSLVEREKETMK